MKECGTASQVPQNEEWFVEWLCFVSGEEDVVEPEEEPMYQ